MTSATRAVLRVIAGAFLVFFLGFLGISVPMYWAQFKILRDWPATEGVVLISRVVRIETTGGSDLHDIEVRFAFLANGRPYSGVIHSNHLSTNRARKERQAAQFPVGSSHPLRYNPADPHDIRAQVGYNVHFFAVPIFVSGVGAIFLVIGLVIWLVSSRGQQASSPGPSNLA